MHLCTDTIDELGAAVVDRLDEVNERSKLRVRTIQIIIVDVQLRIRVCLASGLESDSDERLSENTVENAVAQGAVFLKDFAG